MLHAVQDWLSDEPEQGKSPMAWTAVTPTRRAAAMLRGLIRGEGMVFRERGRVGGEMLSDEGLSEGESKGGRGGRLAAVVGWG